MATPRQQASQTILALEAALDVAEGKWTGAGVAIGSYFGGPGDAIKAQLANYRNNMVPALYRQADKIALTDQAGWDQWAKIATSMLESIERDAQMAASGTAFAIVADVAKQTAKTVGKAAVKVAKTAGAVWDARKWIVGGLLLVVVLAGGGYVYLRFLRK